MGNSIQDYLARKQLVDEQNIVRDRVYYEESSDKEDLQQSIDCKKSRHIFNDKVASSTAKYKNRDVCNGVPNWRETSVAVLYKPNMAYFPPSIIGYFIISDDWDEKTLLALKEKVDADFLVGIQTGSNTFEHLFNHLNFIKAIVKCQPNEVDDLINLLDVYSPRYGICLNAYDIKSLFECSDSFKFIQTSATDVSKSDLIKATTQNLISQLPKAEHMKGVFINPEYSESLSLDDLAYIGETIEASIYIDGEIYYSQSMTEELNCFRLRAIYSEA